MKKKILALFLCCVMVIGLLPATLAFAAETELKVDADTVSLKTTEMKTLTADAGELTGRYQWQIQAGEGVWVNILGANEKTLTLNYGLVASLLLNNTARIRCRMTTDGKTLDSNVVTVEIQHDAAVRKAPAMSPAIGMVTSEAKALGDPIIIPAQTAAPAADQTPADESVQENNQPQADDTAEGDESAQPGVTPQDNGTGDTPATPTTYSIIINYVFQDNSQAANPWTATVAAGSSYSQSIQSPVVVGYTPDKETVEVNVTNISKDETYTVTYSAAEVEYTVKHYKQNVDNDNYTLEATETKKGFTESAVGGSLAKTDYTGFYSLLYDTTTKIAADGSTEVEIKYDRYYYLMNFDLGGGYGVEPIYARYGTPITVGTPTKPGYTFGGWDKTIPDTMPAKNTTFTAKWTVDGQAKVTVVVWGENADDENYSYISNSEIQAKPGDKLTFLICGKEEHTHSNSCGISCVHNTHDLTCYGLSANARPVTPNNEALKYFAQLQGGVQDGYIYYFDDRGYNGNGNLYYLRLNGNYYQYSAKPTANIGMQVGNRVSCDEGFLHSTDYFYKYNLKVTCVHTHTDSCYTCGKTAHKHDTNCFNSPVSMDTTLWRLVKCDEVTVAADGTTIINVYYDRVEFTLHFRKARSDSDDYGTIQKKWGANIRADFQAKSNTAETSSWSRNRNANSPWTSYLDIMPTEDRTYYAYQTDGKSTAYYYVEGLDGEYQLFYTSTASGTGLSVSEEEFIEIPGFTFNSSISTKVNQTFNGAKFYYDRRSYELQFFNRTGFIDEKTATVKYEAPLNSYYFVPDYPTDLEPNAYVFDGWYTTAGCYAGSEADLSKMTMPASDMILYAKWVPKTHKVTTWLTDKMDVAVNVGDTGTNEQTVAHGTQATKPADPTNGEYVFVGWFYKENGVEKAFDFSMPVNRDLGLYAKWSSNKLVAYTIKYAVKNADGTLTYIADDTTGSALAGSTKTFNAKTGTELYEKYQSGFFPMTSSHSLTIDIDATKNVFTFIYVEKASVDYVVKYLEKGTNNVLAEERKVSTKEAVVTETFKQITGYAPDAYQKRLVLSANEEENEIIFWYTKDEIHAPVQIIHWTQNIAGDGYTEYQSSTDLNAKIGDKQTSTELTIPGFTYVKGTAVSGETTVDFTTPKTPEAKLTEAGLVLNLYYDRIEYPYEFRFLEQGTENELADPVKGNARYQAQVTQTAKDIPGYTLVGNVQNQAIAIAIEDPADVAKDNVKIFYYTEQTVDIKYVAVTADSGTLSSYQDNGVKVINGTVNGSTPTAKSGYKFVGWYKDEACTQAVDNSWVGTDNKLTPGKTKNYGTEEKPVMGYEAAIYYAKFEPDVADLTITKTGCQGIDENQSFIFDVTGPDGFSKRVVINGDGSVKITGLKIGEYTVTEVTGWSWRYTPTDGKVSQTIKLEPTGNEVTFTNTRSNDKWLGGDAYNQNKFGNSN